MSSLILTPSGEPLEEMKFLYNNHPLAQLHSKFWGMSMEVEESEWRRTQTPYESQLEVHPGCYVLDIGIKHLPFLKVWIRAEYIRIFDYVERHYNHDRVHNLAPSIVVTGQPGIGESLVASRPIYY